MPVPGWFGHLVAACSAPVAVRSCHHPLLGSRANAERSRCQGLKAGAGLHQGRGAELRCPGLGQEPLACSQSHGGGSREELLPVAPSPELADRGRRAHPGATCDFTEQKCAGKLLGARAGPIAQLRAIAARLCADVRPSPGTGQGAETVSRAVRVPAGPGRFPPRRVRASEPGREVSGRTGERWHRTRRRGQEGTSIRTRSVQSRLLPAAQLQDAVKPGGAASPAAVPARPFPWFFSPRHPGSTRAGGGRQGEEGCGSPGACGTEREQPSSSSAARGCGRCLPHRVGAELRHGQAPAPSRQVRAKATCTAVPCVWVLEDPVPA